MKKLAAFLTAGLCFFSSVALAMSKEIIILHTNDIHGGVDNNISLPCLAQYKKTLQNDGAQVALVDAGDALQGSALAEQTKGAAVLRLMKQTGYDFMLPGRHDFDYGVKHLLYLNTQLQGEYYCINLGDKNLDQASLPGYKIIDFSGTKVGFVGFTAPTAIDELNKANFKDKVSGISYNLGNTVESKKLYKYLQKQINDARSEGARHIILVLYTESLSGSWSPEAIAKNTKGLTCIIMGGTHQCIDNLWVKSQNNKDVLVVQAGSKLQSVGKLTIGKKGTPSSELVYSVYLSDKAVASAVAAERKHLALVARQQVGYSNVYLYSKDPGTRQRYVGSHETNMGNFAADAYKAALGADLVLLNSGELTGELPYGNITYQSLLEAFPHEYSCCLIEATGKQVLDALEMGVHRFPDEFDGFMQVAGLSYTIDTGINSNVVLDRYGNFKNVAGAYRVRNVMVGKSPLALEKIYRVGGSSRALKYLGHGMSMFKGCKVLQEGKILQADASKLYIKNKLKGQITWKYHNPYGEERIKFK